jgi:hypothetical protein
MPFETFDVTEHQRPSTTSAAHAKRTAAQQPADSALLNLVGSVWNLNTR